MYRIIYLSGKWFIIAFLMALMTFMGCKGSDTREEVDSTVEEFAGKKKVDQMKEMERSIAGIQNQQSDRLNELNGVDDEEND